MQGQSTPPVFPRPAQPLHTCHGTHPWLILMSHFFYFISYNIHHVEEEKCMQSSSCSWQWCLFLDFLLQYYNWGSTVFSSQQAAITSSKWEFWTSLLLKRFEGIFKILRQFISSSLKSLEHPLSAPQLLLTAHPAVFQPHISELVPWGSFWEKGHELCWEQSGAVMDPSDSAHLRIMLRCNTTLDLGGALEAMGIYPKTMVRFYNPKKTLHTQWDFASCCSRFSPRSNMM